MLGPVHKWRHAILTLFRPPAPPLVMLSHVWKDPNCSGNNDFKVPQNEEAHRKVKRLSKWVWQVKLPERLVCTSFIANLEKGVCGNCDQFWLVLVETWERCLWQLRPVWTSFNANFGKSVSNNCDRFGLGERCFWKMRPVWPSFSANLEKGVSPRTWENIWFTKSRCEISRVQNAVWQ